MASGLIDIKKLKRNFAGCLLAGIARYPFWDAVSTMMIFAEIENKQKKEIDLPKLAIFADAGLLILLGTFMSFKPNTRRVCATLAALQLVARTVFQYNVHGNLPDYTFNHILMRHIGVVGSYLVLGSGIGENRAKRTTIFHLACLVFGILFASQATLLMASSFEQKFLAYYLPKQVKKIISFSIIKSFFTVCLAVCACVFILQTKGFVSAKKFVTIFWLCLCLPGDVMARYWANDVLPWVVYRLGVSSACTAAGLLVIFVSDC